MAKASRTNGVPSELPTWVGMKPHRVWVGPVSAKKGVVYLRYHRPAKGWKWISLRFTLTDCPPAERRERERQAYARALDQVQRLTGKRADQPSRGSRTLTLADAWAILTDAKAGKYPTDSVNRRELKKALADATKYLGSDFPWIAFDRARLREVTRAHARAVMARNHVGFRAAQILGTRLITIARLLRDEGHVADDYQVPGGREWIGELRTYVVAQRGDVLPEPHRPRYTLEEFRRLLAFASRADERFGLMFLIGAEARSGQVARARRSHLDTVRWDLTIHGRGKKRGTVIRLTPAQRAGLMAALETGYLSACEARHQRDGVDYVLFPSALRPPRITPSTPVRFAVPELQRTASKRQVNEWHARAEELAEIPHLVGRAWYGARRQGVDASIDEGATPDVLENIGGWSDPRTPTTVYRDRGRDSVLDKSAAIRARVRGETPDA